MSEPSPQPPQSQPAVVGLPTPAPVPLPAPQPRRRRWWVSLLLSLVIFGSGMGTGVVGTLVRIRHGLLAAIRHPEGMPELITQRLRRRLNLNDEQAGQVLAILRVRQRAFQTIRVRVQPEVEAQLDLVESEVAAVLNDQQREKWETRFRELRATWTPPMPAKEK